MNEIKLKPCPFCGGMALMVNTYVCGTDCKSVYCVKCHAQVANFATKNAEERAAEAWNRRADNEN